MVLVASIVLTLVFTAGQVTAQNGPHTSPRTNLPIRVALVMPEVPQQPAAEVDAAGILKRVALDLYRPFFITVHSLREVPPSGFYDLTISPTVVDLRLMPNRNSWGSTPAASAVTELVVLAGERLIIKKTYQSAEYARFVAGSETGAATVCEKALQDSLVKGLSDIVRHPEVQRLIPSMRTDMLVRACETNNMKKVADLLLLGDDPNGVGENGWTPLMAASYAGHTQTVKLLLSSGANPNAIARDGATPLIMTALKGHVDAARALLAAGADPKMTMKSGKTAFALAKERKQAKMVALLQGKGGEGDRPVKGETPRKPARPPSGRG